MQKRREEKAHASTSRALESAKVERAELLERTQHLIRLLASAGDSGVNSAVDALKELKGDFQSIDDVDAGSMSLKEIMLLLS